MINNPILPGFNPDPSFCCVGPDYYIATSTFQWYPGVQIHHSTDLVNWRLVSRPLCRASQLDMRGNPDDCGIWAPCLSYADNQFWLVYTDVKRHAGDFKDAHNYIVTSSSIDGDWSDPTYINSSGFDPSLFHDDNGKKYFVNMRWNHRGVGTGCNSAHDAFDGILLQEWSPTLGLIGVVKNIYSGTERGLTEAPHIFKRGSYYYLTTAEGGTSYDHAVTLSRSKELWGPYENHPNLHVMTSAHDSSYPIQRCGHGQYVEGADGTAWHTFLMGRPIVNGERSDCPLGRETGIAKCVWGDDDWLYLDNGGLLPPLQIPAAEKLDTEPSVHQHFDELPTEFQWLRTPFPERLFRCEQGELVLLGRESIGSWFEQSLVARRQEHFDYTATTTLSFDPENYQQGAGLITYYDRHRFHALLVTQEQNHKVLTLVSCCSQWPEGTLSFPLEKPVELPSGPVTLSVSVRGGVQQFSWKVETKDTDTDTDTDTDAGTDAGTSTGEGKIESEKLSPIGPELDAALISDEGGRDPMYSSFTGAFVGLVAFDITGAAKEAKFSSFSYVPS